MNFNIFFGKTKKRKTKRKTRKVPSKTIRNKAKKLGIKITLKRGNKRYYKTEALLLRQIKTKTKSKTKASSRAKRTRVLRKYRKSLPFAQELKTKNKIKKALKHKRYSGPKRFDMKELKAHPLFRKNMGSEFGRMPSLAQSTGFIKKPYNISMVEAITGMKRGPYNRHIMSKTASNVAIPQANNYYRTYGLGMKANPSKFGSCGCNKRRSSSKKSGFGFF